MAVHFDDSGHVTFMDHNDDVSGCLPDGICNYSGSLYSNPSIAVLSAPKGDDEQAKFHQVHKDECVIYIYQEPVSLSFSSGPVVLSIDGKAHGVINYKTFLFVKHLPGDVNIKAYQFQITTQCRGGRKLYIKVVESWKSYNTGKDLSLVAETEGEGAIASRKLALPY